MCRSRLGHEVAVLRATIYINWLVNPTPPLQKNRQASVFIVNRITASEGGGSEDDIILRIK